MAGISGLGVATATVGGFLVYSGIRNVTILTGLRSILKGQPITNGPQTSTDISPSDISNTDELAGAVGAASDNVPVSGGTLARLVAGIKIQESGGNYRAGNPSGAIGAYQILASNVPSWSKEALGYSITPQQFLASPALQDKIATFKISQYLQQFGVRGAAAAWYAGPGNANLNESTAAQPGGPSIKGYVDSVLANGGLH